MSNTASPKSMVQRVWDTTAKRTSSKNWSYRSHPRAPKNTVRELIAKRAGFAGIRVGKALFSTVEEAGQRFKGMEGFGEFRIKNPAGETLFPV